MKSIYPIGLLLLLIGCFEFCTKNNAAVSTAIQPSLPATVLNYLVTYPAHIQNALNTSDNTPANNPITNDGATLGRVLFYDKQLSIDNAHNCASCHNQKFAFDDTAVLSHGVNGGTTTRNSMALLNLRFYQSGKMFWDERAVSVEKQALQPIQDHAELGLTLSLLESKVQSLSYYPALFQKAFNSPVIDSVQIAKALAQFERSIVTYQARYDSVKQGLSNFTSAEAQGEQLFLTAASPRTCASCHTPPLFLTSNPVAGFGLADANDKGINNQNRFKAGSIRNISTRSNLFHNGSIATVQAMLTAGAPGSGSNPIPSHSVAPQDVNNLMAFLNTLTDKTIATELRFSSPF